MEAKNVKSKEWKTKKAFYEKKYIQLKRKIQEIKINKIINNWIIFKLLLLINKLK